MANISAAAIANEFLDIQASDQSNYPPIDQMKIQKLVYYAQAWSLAIRNEPLFEDDIEAWPWGPVVRSIYGAFRNCGRSSIKSERAQELVKTGDGVLDFHFAEPPPPTPNVRAFLRAVWESHKSMTGIQLSNATHAEGEPWFIVKDQYGSLDGKPRIPNELIRDVFRAKLPRPAGDPAAAAAV